MNKISNPALDDTRTTTDATAESLRLAYDLGRQSADVIDVDGREIVLSPESLVVTDLEGFQANPSRTRRAQTFADPASFADYVGRYAIGDTLLVGSLSKKSVTATLDYDGLDKPRWGEHTATFQAIATPEWKALRAVDGKWLSQTETADFFDLWNHIIVEPSAAHMAEVAMNLAGTVNATFEARIVRANGSASFVCREETETNNVKVPNKVHVSVWPFEGTPLVDVLVQVRFRIEGGKPKFQLVVQNADRVDTEALKATFGSIEKATDRKVLVAP